MLTRLNENMSKQNQKREREREEEAKVNTTGCVFPSSIDDKFSTLCNSSFSSSPQKKLLHLSNDTNSLYLENFFPLFSSPLLSRTIQLS
jgi:hypothetical protein